MIKHCSELLFLNKANPALFLRSNHIETITGFNTKCFAGVGRYYYLAFRANCCCSVKSFVVHNESIMRQYEKYVKYDYTLLIIQLEDDSPFASSEGALDNNRDTSE